MAETEKKSPFKVGEKYKTDGTLREWLVVYRRDDGRLLLLSGDDTRWVYDDGRVYTNDHCPADIMPRTKEVTRWLNVWGTIPNRAELSCLFLTQEEADKHRDRIACVPITFTIPDDDGSETA